MHRLLSTRTDTTDSALEQLLAQQPEFQDILPFEKSSHNSATIIIPAARSENDDENDKEQKDPTFANETFRNRLAATVEACRALEKSSLWVHVPMSRASLMEDMVDAGFQFHHAAGQIAVLNLWLRESESKIPDYATHNGKWYKES